MKPKNCDYCFINKSVYNVIAPACVDIAIAQICPSCFQKGIDEGAIIWIGDKPFGVCHEHLGDHGSAKAG